MCVVGSDFKACNAWQVWWYVGGCFSQLAVHNLANNETKSVKTNRNMPGIIVMAQVREPTS
jgi:hypothetical protein